jgi:mannan endo-1,4-beta-mannosidase
MNVKEMVFLRPQRSLCLILGVFIMLNVSCVSKPEETASPNKKRLLQYLNDGYGKRILSGQMDTSWTTNAVMDMIERVHTDTGKYPAIKGFDFIQLPYDGGTEQTGEAIEWWNGKNNGVVLLPEQPNVHGIVTFCWHWKIGPRAEFYTEKTDFRIPFKNGALDTASPNFRFIESDLEKVSVMLRQLADLDIPVLWRPLHEAAGNWGKFPGGTAWFWWGAGGPEPYKALWNYMYDYLAVKKNLKNLVWVWNGQDAAWFPHPDTVDIAGNDLYPGPKNYASQADKFNETLAMVPAKNRIVALTENGAIPDPDNCIADKAMWSWFMTWNDGYGSIQGQTHENNFWTGEYHNTRAHKLKVYHHDTVITLDKLPDITEYK